MLNPLTKVRAALGLSQSELARLAGLSASAISQAEGGTLGLPNALVEALSHLGYQPDALRREQQQFRRMLAAATLQWLRSRRGGAVR